MTGRLGTLMILVFVLTLGAAFTTGCGPITEEDLQKWSHNEVGFKKMQEVINDPEVPDETKIRGLEVLVENGAGERVRGIVRDHEKRDELVSALATSLLEKLKSDNEDLQGKARDTLMQLLAMLDDEGRSEVQKQLAAWAFGDITIEMPRDEVWEKVQNRMSFSQVRELEKFGVEPALIMIQKRLETKEFGILDWIDYVQAQATEQEKPELSKRALAALRIAHAGLFEEMKTDENMYFRPQELIIVEKFYNIEAVLYLLELSEHFMLDRGTQMESLMRAHELFDKIIPEDQRTKYTDKLLPVMMRRLPLLNGQKRIEWASEVLARSAVPGLEKISMFDIAKSKAGKEQKTIKIWLSRKYYNTGAYLYGVMDGYLESRIDAQIDILKAQWLKDARWPPKAPEPAPAPAVAEGEAKPAEGDKAAEAKPAEGDKAAEAKPAEGDKAAEATPAEGDKAAEATPAEGDKAAEAKPAEGDKAAEATAPGAAEEEGAPKIENDPQFQAELNAVLDTTLAPELKRHLASPMLITRLLGVAGLRRLGTPGAVAVLESVRNDKTDVDMYFLERDDAGKLVKKGYTLGALADSALAAIQLDHEFAALQIEMEEKQQLPAKHLQIIRRQMMLDMSTSSAELREKYTAKIEEQKKKVEAYKERFKEELDKYHRYIKILCAKQVKDYPSPVDAQAMERYIDGTALVCEKEAREALNEKKLSLFKFTKEHYRAAVILAIKKREEVRRRVLRARVRAYLRVAAEVFVQTKAGVKTLGKLKVWTLKNADSRKVVDQILEEALKKAKEAHELAPPDKKARIGLTQEAIDEYGTMELAEGYVLSILIGLNFGLDWSEATPETKALAPEQQQYRYWSHLMEAASKDFTDDYWLKINPTLLDFFNEDLDASYAAFTVAIDGLEIGMKTWGIPETTKPKWDKVVKALNDVQAKSIALAKAKAPADAPIPDEVLATYQKYYPSMELLAEAYIISYDKARRIKAEQDKKAEEAKAKAEAAKKPAEAKPADAKPAEAKPAEAKPADAKPAEAKPAEAKPAEAKPAEATPADAKPADAKPADAKPADAKPAAK
jgi:hypothetical protein